MHASLAKLAALPDDTKVYCAHEYTLDNIRFAKIVDPGNAALHGARSTRARKPAHKAFPPCPPPSPWKKPPTPSCAADDPHVIEAASHFAGHPLTEPADVFAAIRQWKDQV